MNLDPSHRNKLLELARQSIDSGLTALRWVAMPSMELPAALMETRGSYVTLRINKQLRGSCGNLAASLPIGEDVWRNAWASAFADPRFAPLDAEEWGDVRIHISVSSRLEPLAVTTEAELVAVLRSKVDGLLLERDDARATFLPEVWDQIPDPQDFVRHLKEKAGWPANSWSPLIRVHRYTTESFGEASTSDSAANDSRRSTAA